MRRYVFLILVVMLAFYFTGCGKKKETIEQAQEPLSIEVSPNGTTSVTTAQALVMPEVSVPVPEKIAELPLPPQGPYKPTNQQIQSALKNAGFYSGGIDGKIGPLTTKAIKEFQAANKLQADGKVGLKTWAVLSTHLNPQAVEPVAAVRAKRR